MSHYRLKTIRLINFHNFTDAEIPVRGHLFMVGDNTSGKTTVLDAVQWVLSAGQFLQFNAAAHVWGKKEDGRTLKGAVLRMDPERGILNLGRTITYAAIELDNEKGSVLTLGMGAEMAHPEAQIQQWAFAHSGPLSEVKLLKDMKDGTAPLTKEELRKQLGHDKVFFQTGRYRSLVASKLTRDDEAYNRLTWFWMVSKAYKEMASQTRDYSELLRKLLPEPDEGPFMDVAKGLAALAGIEERLRALQAQISYLQKLSAAAERVGVHREEVARYEYILQLRGKEAIQREIEDVERRLSATRDENAGKEEELARATKKKHSVEAQLIDLRAKDEDGLLERRERLDSDLKAAKAEVELRNKSFQSAKMALARIGKELSQARHDMSEALLRLAGRLDECLDKGMGQACPALVASIRQGSKSEAPEMEWTQIESQSARHEATAFEVACSDRLHELQQARLNVERESKEAGAMLEKLETLLDPLPEIPGYPECLRRLQQRALKFAPLYRVVERGEHGDEKVFRELETVLGQRILAALVPEPDDAAEVAKIVLKDFPSVPVVRTDLPEPEVGAGWLRKLLIWERLPAEARSYLLRMCGDDGLTGIRLEDGIAEQYGARFRVEPLPFPLMGAEVRQAAHQKRLAEAKRRVTGLKARVSEFARLEEAETERVRRAKSLLAAIAQMHEGEVREADRLCVEIGKRELSARERQKRTKEDLDAQAALVETRQREMDEVHARISKTDLKALQERIKIVESEKAAVESALAQLNARIGGLQSEQKQLENARQALDANLRDAEAQLRLCALRLEPLVDDQARQDLNHYVMETRQGRQFTKIPNIQERLKEAERAQLRSVTEIQGEGGILHAQYSGLFGLTYDESSNRILDRKGELLGRLLESFTAQVSENEQLLDGERRKLFEEVMLGDLARSLRIRIADLEETIKGVNHLLKQRVFGERTRYSIIVRPVPEHVRFIEAIKRLAAFDPASREEFRAELSERLKALPQDGGALPPQFDYRQWFDFQLKMTAHTDDGVVLAPHIARQGSTGEQAVPKYLIILAMANLLFKMSGAKIRVILFDEVFYGIDQSRREELLALATDLDLQLVVASPEQAGDRESYRKATTVFLVKDADCEVHLSVNHLWTDAPLQLFEA